MSRTEEKTEQSMEEILASIRKIIAEEPAGTRPPPVASASPRLTESPPKSSPWGNGIELPMGTPAQSNPAPAKPTASSGSPASFDRPSPQLPQAPAMPAPKARISDIDDDLADLIEAPAPPVPAPTTASVPAPAQAPQKPATPAVPPPAAAEPAMAKPMLFQPSASAPPAAAAQPRGPAPAVEAPAVAAAREKWEGLIGATASTSVKTDTTKDTAPAAPVTAAALAAKAAAAAAGAPIAASTPATLPPIGAGPRNAGFFPPPGFRVEPSFPVPDKPAAEAEPHPAEAAAPVAPVSPSPSAPSGPPSAGVTDAAIPKQVAPTSAIAAPAETGEQIVVTPSRRSEPSMAVPDPSPSNAPLSSVGHKLDQLASDNPSAAAAAALDALNAGLAAVSVAPQPSAGHASAAPQTPGAAQSRTLEDVVADMVRPMLEKWIDEHMPKIVERALRLDASVMASRSEHGKNGNGSA